MLKVQTVLSHTVAIVASSPKWTVLLIFKLFKGKLIYSPFNFSVTFATFQVSVATFSSYRKFYSTVLMETSQQTMPVTKLCQFAVAKGKGIITLSLIIDTGRVLILGPFIYFTNLWPSELEISPTVIWVLVAGLGTQSTSLLFHTCYLLIIVTIFSRKLNLPKLYFSSVSFHRHF